jgi:tetratricopeptide (TPR) repeat protein
MNRSESRVVLAMVVAFAGCGNQGAKTTEPQLALGNADYTELAASRDKLQQALAGDPENLVTFAYLAEVNGLAALLYGTSADEAEAAYKASAPIATGQPGARERALGKAALELSRLHVIDKPEPVLADTERTLAALVDANPKDAMARWLHGRALIAAGARDRGNAELDAASPGFVLAQIDVANRAVDEGRTADALKAFEQTNAPSHSLVIVGKALANAEGFDNMSMMGMARDLEAKLPDAPPRIAAYRSLAVAMAQLGFDEYADAGDTLDKLGQTKRLPGEPRFWAHVAWAHLRLGRGGQRGDLRTAINARRKVRWYGPKPAPDPMVALVDAELHLAAGKPEKVDMQLAGEHASLVKLHAMLDRLAGERLSIDDRLRSDVPAVTPKTVRDTADEVLVVEPSNFEARIARQLADVLALAADRTTEGVGKRNAAIEELRKLGARHVLARHALGAAYLAIGDLANAKLELERVIANTSDAAPNPVGYKTHTLLAEVLLAGGDLRATGAELDRAIEANGGYIPALELQARVVLRNNEPDRALSLLAPIKREGTLSARARLTVAEALVVRKAVSQSDKDQAKALLVELKGMPGVDPSEIGRIAALIDPKLPKQLGVPVGKLASVKP